MVKDYSAFQKKIVSRFKIQSILEKKRVGKTYRDACLPCQQPYTLFVEHDVYYFLLPCSVTTAILFCLGIVLFFLLTHNKLSFYEYDIHAWI